LKKTQAHRDGAASIFGILDPVKIFDEYHGLTRVWGLQRCKHVIFRKFIYLSLVLVLLAGCATSKPLGQGINLSGELLYLSSTEKLTEALHQIADPAASFWYSEDAKIQYLMKRTRSCPYTFERNEKRYTGAMAARFISWKSNLKNWSNRVNSAQELVDVVCCGSSKSGKPYILQFPDGTQHNFQNILQNELNALDIYLEQKRTALAEQQLLEDPTSIQKQQLEGLKGPISEEQPTQELVNNTYFKIIQQFFEAQSKKS